MASIEQFVLTGDHLQGFKIELEILERESPELVALGVPEITATVAGVQQQCQVAHDLGKNPAALVYIARLDTDRDNGYRVFTYPVVLKHALNLIKTMKKRKS